MPENRFAHPSTLAEAVPELDLGGYLPRRRSSSESEPRPVTPAISAMTAAIDRLEALVEEETTAFGESRAIDFGEINRRKSHSLLEITRLARSLPVGGDPGLGARLGRLRDKLIANHRLLGLHLTAVREIADLMAGVLSEAESDGTYGMSGAPRGAQP